MHDGRFDGTQQELVLLQPRHHLHPLHQNIEDASYPMGSTHVSLISPFAFQVALSDAQFNVLVAANHSGNGVPLSFSVLLTLAHNLVGYLGDLTVQHSQRGLDFVYLERRAKLVFHQQQGIEKA